MLTGFYNGKISLRDLFTGLAHTTLYSVAFVKLLHLNKFVQWPYSVL